MAEETVSSQANSNNNQKSCCQHGSWSCMHCHRSVWLYAILGIVLLATAFGSGFLLGRVGRYGRQGMYGNRNIMMRQGGENYLYRAPGRFVPQQQGEVPQGQPAPRATTTPAK